MDAAELAKLYQSQGSSRSKVAALCFLIYEACITFDDEVAHIWLTRWTSLKVLYFFTRYYAILVLILLNARKLTCQQWVLIEGVSAVLLEVAVEVMLILRIRAMYVNNKIVLRGVLGVWVAQLIVIIVSLAISIPKFMNSDNCLSGNPPKEMVGYTIASIAFEAVLFVLAVLKSPAAPTSSISSLNSIRMQAQNTRLLSVLVRDSIWIFAAILGVMIVNAVLFTTASVTLAPIGFPWVLAIFGSGGPRLMLNVRHVHSRLSTNFSSIGDLSSVVIKVPTTQRDMSMASRTSSSSMHSISSRPPSPPAPAVSKPRATISTKSHTKSSSVSLKPFLIGKKPPSSTGSSSSGRYSVLSNQDDDDGEEATVSRYTPVFQDGGIVDTRGPSAAAAGDWGSTGGGGGVNGRSWLRRFTADGNSISAVHGHSPLRENSRNNSPVVSMKSTLRMNTKPERNGTTLSSSSMDLDAEDVHLLTPTTFFRDHGSVDSEHHHQHLSGDAEPEMEHEEMEPEVSYYNYPVSNIVGKPRPDEGTRWV